MSEPLPGWYDDLEGFEVNAWQQLTRGAADRRSAFHTPVVASVGPNGEPNARTVVLRGCDPKERTLRFHTDKRAAKVAELQASPSLCLVFYDKGQKLQLRVRGRAELHGSTSEIGGEAWDKTRSFSRECYRVAPDPGSPIGKGGEYGHSERTDGGDAFTAVVVHIETIEALYLAAAGHRRASFTISARQWLVP